MRISARGAAQVKARRASGFSLLEVLISLVIMSVGLLGVAGLMSTTLKNNDSAYIRSQATAQAYNIIDRMRANNAGINSLYYLTPMPAAPSAATQLPSACTGSGAGCTSAALASYDIAQWEYELVRMLPQGRGSISTTLGPMATTYTVTVLWNDSRANQALGGMPAATTFSLVVSSSF
jgi:type IV pilus assembly protein PilV